MGKEHELTLFDRAVVGLKNGYDDIVQDCIFNFQPEDRYYVDRVAKAIRMLLTREDVTPLQIMSIGRALHGLGRFPLRTSGLDIHISLSYKMGQGYQSYDLYISTDRFSTESGGYDNFGGMGTDSFSGPSFSIGTEYREFDGFLIDTESWPEQFIEMLKNTLEIYDDCDDNLLDWEHPNGDIFWEWIIDHA